MKKLGYITGRRIRGDLEMGLDRETGRPGAIIGPGERIENRPEQDIYEVSDIQNYRVGSRMMLGDWVFHYCQADEALSGLRGKFTDGDRVYANTLALGPVTPAEVGDLTVTYVPDTAIALNELAGGYLGCFNPYLTKQIKSNTECAGAGAPVTLTLERPLPYAILVGAWLVSYPNLYRHVLNMGGLAANAIWHSVCAIPVRTTVQPGNWFWGLTWGPVAMVVNTWGNLVGRTANQRNIFFGHDGGIVYHAGVGATDCLMQNAGHLVMNGNTPSTPNGDQLVFIQLAP